MKTNRKKAKENDRQPSQGLFGKWRQQRDPDRERSFRMRAEELGERIGRT